MSVKQLRPLFISARRSSWRMLDWHANESDRRYQTLRDQILQRDDFTCIYCGFRSEKYQQLNHLNHDHGDNKPGNVVTACPLCHQCFHLGLAGIQHSGVIIYCPELSQAQLNNIVRAIFIAVHTGGENEQSARTMYDALDSRTSVIEENFGTGTSNPLAFGQAFVEMSPEDYQTRKERMPGLRLLARMQGFGKEVAYWRSDKSAFGALQDADWQKMVPLPEFVDVEGDPEVISVLGADDDRTFGDAGEDVFFGHDEHE